MQKTSQPPELCGFPDT